VPRLFTLAEAEELLPTVIPILEAIRDANRESQASEAELTRLLGPTRSNGHGVDADAVGRLRDAGVKAAAIVRARIAELEGLGIELKDPEMGLIDFRSDRDGRVVYLCWRLGEQRIDWWHDLDAGFAGRQPLVRDE
jgi:hypothetical protein